MQLVSEDPVMVCITSKEAVKPWDPGRGFCTRRGVRWMVGAHNSDAQTTTDLCCNDALQPKVHSISRSIRFALPSSLQSFTAVGGISFKILMVLQTRAPSTTGVH